MWIVNLHAGRVRVKVLDVLVVLIKATTLLLIVNISAKWCASKHAVNVRNPTTIKLVVNVWMGII